jgi:hypothetical protein
LLIHAIGDLWFCDFWAIKIPNETPLSSSFVWDFRVEFGMDGWAWFIWI